MAFVRDLRVNVGAYDGQRLMAEFSFNVEFSPVEVQENRHYGLRLDLVELSRNAQGLPFGQGLRQMSQPFPAGMPRMLEDSLRPNGRQVQQVTRKILLDSGAEQENTSPGGGFQHGFVPRVRVAPNLRFVESNPAFLHELGWHPSEAEHLTLLDILSPESAREVMRVMAELPTQRLVRDRQLQLRHRSGQTIDVMVDFEAFQNGSPQPAQIELSFRKAGAPAPHRGTQGLDPQGNGAVAAHYSSPGNYPRPQQPGGNTSNPEDKLPALFARHSESGVLVTDRAGNVLWVNPAFQQITRYRAEDVLQHPFLQPRRIAQAPPEVLGQIGNAINQQQGLKTTCPCFRADGQTFEAELELTPVRNGYGPAEHFVILLREAPARQENTAPQTQGYAVPTPQAFARQPQEQQPQTGPNGHPNDLLQRLKEAEETVESLFDSAPVGICITDEDGVFERVNDTYCSIYGYRSEELIGEHFTKVTKTSDKNYWKRKHRDFIEGADEVRGEFTVKHKNGKELTILTDSARINGSDGRARKVTFVLNITDRKRFEKQLRSSEDRLQKMVDTAPVGICVTDENGIFVNVNDTYSAIYGYSADELIGEHFTKVTKPHDRKFWERKHRDFVDGADEVRGEFNVLAKGGRELTILTDSARVQDSEGKTQKITYVLDITERKKAEKRLERSQERLRSMVRTAPVGICVTDSNGNFVEVNETYTAIYGYSADELIGQPFTVVTRPKDREFWHQKHREFINGAQEVRGEFNVLHKSGRELTILTDSARVEDNEGNVQKVTYVLDITERKKSEKRLKNSEERLASLVESAPVGICVTNESGIFESVNETYCRIYGYDTDELLGNHFSMVVPKAQEEFWRQKHDNFLAGADETRGEFTVVTKSGVQLTILADSLRVNGSDGRPKKVTFVLDITERKRQEEMLRLSEDRSRKLIETAPVGICLTNEQGVFEEVNDTYCQIYGYEARELVGQSFTKVVPKTKIDFWRQKHDKFIAGQDETRGEFVVVRKDGKELTILADSSRIIGTDGRPKKVTFVLDITERKAAEERLVQQEEELRQNLEEMQTTQEHMRQAQKELSVSEQLNRSVINTAPVGICITNEQGIFETVNEAYLGIYGYDKEEVIGKPFTIVTDPKDQVLWEQRHRNFIEGGSDVRGEFNVRAKDGTPLIVMADSARITGSDGRPKKVTFVLDITQRKKQEEQLLEQEHRLRQNIEEMQATQEQMRKAQADLEISEAINRNLVETAPVGICITDKNGVFETVNETYCAIYGYDKEEVVGQHFTLVTPADATAFWHKKHDDFIAGMDETRGEFNVIAKDGTRLTVLADSARVTGSDGEPRKVTFVLDITERKRQEELLRSQEAQLRVNIEELEKAQTAMTEANLELERNYKELEKAQHEQAQAKAELEANYQQLQQARNESEQAKQELEHKVRELSETQEKMERAQKELEVSEALNRNMIETAPVGISMINTEGYFETVNQTYAEIVGVDSQELIGSSLINLVPPNRKKAWKQHIEQFFAGQWDGKGEFNLLHRNGNTIIVFEDAVRITGRDGLPRKVTFTLDITERKESEAEIQKLSLVASQTDNGIFMTDKAGKIEWTNDAFTAITGKQRAEAFDQKFLELLGTDATDPATLQKFENGLKAGSSVDEELVTQGPEGAQIWVQLTLTAVHDEAGTIAQFIGVMSDITDKKKREEELAAALDEIRNTQDQLLVSEKMAALGQLIAGVAHEVNTPMSAVKASVGNMMRMLPETISELPALLMKVPKTHMPLFKKLVLKSVTSDVVLSTKEERKLRRSITQMLEENDVANAEDLAENLVEIRVVENVEEFLPLLKSKTSLQVLDMAYKLGQLKVNMSNIDIASNKTAKVVKALKNYSHVQSSDRLVETDLSESIDTILTLYHNQTKYGIEVECNYDDRLPKLQLYPDEIGQVWTNIIQNAIQVLDGEGKLTISTELQDDMAVVKINDNGPGIPEEIQQRIFEPFFTTKGQGEGTGLGLDICKKIVEKHLGTLEVESEPGSTTFIISLPLEADLQPQQAGELINA